MGLILKLIKNKEELQKFVDDEVFMFTYDCLNNSMVESCLLVKYDNEIKFNLSFALVNPDRLFTVIYKEGKYFIDMKESSQFTIRNLDKEKALKTIELFNKRKVF